MCIPIHVHILSFSCIYTFTYIYMYTCTCTHTHTHTYTCTHAGWLPPAGIIPRQCPCNIMPRCCLHPGASLWQQLPTSQLDETFRRHPLATCKEQVAQQESGANLRSCGLRRRWVTSKVRQPARALENPAPIGPLFSWTALRRSLKNPNLRLALKPCVAHGDRF